MLQGADIAVTPGVDVTNARQHVFVQKACTNPHSADLEPWPATAYMHEQI